MYGGDDGHAVGDVKLARHVSFCKNVLGLLHFCALVFVIFNKGPMFLSFCTYVSKICD